MVKGRVGSCPFCISFLIFLDMFVIVFILCRCFTFLILFFMFACFCFVASCVDGSVNCWLLPYDRWCRRRRRFVAQNQETNSLGERRTSGGVQVLEEEKASRICKAATGVGCDRFHRETKGEQFSENVDQCWRWPQQASMTTEWHE